MLNLNKLNKSIKKEYPELQLVKGKGYFYFISENPLIFKLECTSVYVYLLNDLTLEQWLEEARNINQKIQSIDC